MLSDDFFQAVLADVAFDFHSIAEYRRVAADELDVMEFLGFKIVGAMRVLTPIKSAFANTKSPLTGNFHFPLF